MFIRVTLFDGTQNDLSVRVGYCFGNVIEFPVLHNTLENQETERGIVDDHV